MVELQAGRGAVQAVKFGSLGFLADDQIALKCSFSIGIYYIAVQSIECSSIGHLIRRQQLPLRLAQGSQEFPPPLVSLSFMIVAPFFDLTWWRQHVNSLPASPSASLPLQFGGIRGPRRSESTAYRSSVRFYCRTVAMGCQQKRQCIECVHIVIVNIRIIRTLVSPKWRSAKPAYRRLYTATKVLCVAQRGGDGSSPSDILLMVRYRGRAVPAPLNYPRPGLMTLCYSSGPLRK